MCHHFFYLSVLVIFSFVSMIKSTNNQNFKGGLTRNTGNQKKIVQEKSDLYKQKKFSHQHSWRSIQKKIQDTVVQLFVEATPFNWTEPFKAPDQERAFGSGFFIDETGHIVSNYHVIEDAVRVTIQVPSCGKELFTCSLVGVCPERDISLLKLTEESRQVLEKKIGKIPYLSFGNSDTIVRTEKIMALGYPLGQEKLKSTQGIVSGRETLGTESYFQITAALNPGNSGGPSINEQGEVIGINTARISSAQNVGYVTPIDDVKSVIRDLHKISLLRKPMLGCSFNYGNKAMIDYLRNPGAGGLYIARVFKNSLFEKAGVQEGDMIYKIQEHDVDLYGETAVSWSEDRVPLHTLINRFEIGQAIHLELYRSGKKQVKKFIFDHVDLLPIRKRYADFEKIDYEIIAGMVFMELSLNHVTLFEESNPRLGRFCFQENLYKPKIILTHIFSGSSAYEARVLSPGEIISEINGKKVATLQELREACLLRNDYLTIKSEEHRLMVLEVAKLCSEEARNAQRYHYEPSLTSKQLKKKHLLGHSQRKTLSSDKPQ